MNGTQQLALIIIGICHFFRGCCYLLPAIHFPQIAEAKGYPPSEYEVVFGIFDAAALISCLVCGKYLNALGARRLTNNALLLFCIMTALFSLVDLITPRIVFLSISIIIRMLTGIADGAYAIGSYAIMLTLYSGKNISIFAALESFFGSGLVVGPIMGRAFFDIDGFYIIYMLILLVTAAYAVNAISSSVCLISENPPPNFRILLYVQAQMCALTLFLSTLSNTFVATMVEPHLRFLVLERLQIGSMFMLLSMMYTISAPIWGFILDRGFAPNYVGLIASVANLMAFILIGSASLLNSELNTVICILFLILQGIGIGGYAMGCFAGLKTEALAIGYDDDINTYGIITGIFFACCYLGCVLGPIISGVLVQFLGFSISTQIILTFHVFLLFVHIMLICIRRCNQNKERENYENID